MAIIGEFTKENGTYRGYIQTLELSVGVHLKEIHKEKDAELPNYVAFAANGAQLGSARIKTGQRSGKDYIRLSVDDPSFASPIHANLIEKDGKHLLMHSRSRKQERGMAQTQTQNKAPGMER